MNILSPNIRFNILQAECALPNSLPITNEMIWQHFPRTAAKSPSFHKKMAQMIEEELGFSQRYWVCKPWESLDNATDSSETLAYHATQKIITKEDNNEINAFILGSTTNARYSGSQACAVAGRLGLCASAYDFKAGCSTSLASLTLAYSLMAFGLHRILICCSETMSKIIDPDNEKTWLGVADGAAALLMEKDNNGQFCVEKSLFSTDGRYVDAFTTQGQLPPTLNIIQSDGYFLKGDENLLKELALEKYSLMLKHISDEIDMNEVRWIIPHQVNRKLIDELISKFALEHCQLLWDAHNIGNIGGASILYSLSHAFNTNQFSENGKILMMSVGGGLSYAIQVLSYKAEPIL